MILFVNTHLKPDEKYGGVVYSGDGLFKGLSKLSSTEGVCVSSKPAAVANHYSSENLVVHCYKSFFKHGLGLSLTLLFRLPRHIFKADFIVINGIYTFPVTVAAIFAILFRKKFSIAPRGGLEPWRLKQKRQKKFLFNVLFTNYFFKKCSFIHVISEMEAGSVNPKLKDKIFICPNGYNVDYIENQILQYNLKDKKNDIDYKDILFLSRMDKEKGLDILITAFSEVIRLPNLKNNRLSLIGPDNNKYLESLKIDFASLKINWLPGLYGSSKNERILSSDIVILPSYSENFGNIVLEALALGIPVITTTGTPWPKIFTKVNCGWISEPNEEDLYRTLIIALNTQKSELIQMGKRGREFVMENYAWESIAVSFLAKIDESLIA